MPLITLDQVGPDPSNQFIRRTIFPGILILEESQCLKKTRYTEEQIAFALCQAESGTPVAEVVCKMSITEQTLYRWKKQFASIGVAEFRRLKQLEDENPRLNKLMADLSLDKTMARDVLKKYLTYPARARVVIVLKMVVRLMYPASREWAAVATRP